MMGVTESTRPRSCAIAIAEALAMSENNKIFFMVKPFQKRMYNAPRSEKVYPAGPSVCCPDRKSA